MRLERVSTVEALAHDLRRRILAGDLAGGARLREQELSDAYGVARHSVRAALRALHRDGLVRIEPHRGARVAALDADDLRALGELRIALECEAARLALARHRGTLPRAVHEAADAIGDVTGDDLSVAAAHEAFHHAIVLAAESPRIAAAHAAVAAEHRLFAVQLRFAWDMDRLADEHRALVAALERTGGTDVLRAHIEAGTDAVVRHLEASPS